MSASRSTMPASARFKHSSFAPRRADDSSGGRATSRTEGRTPLKRRGSRSARCARKSRANVQLQIYRTRPSAFLLDGSCFCWRRFQFVECLFSSLSCFRVAPDHRSRMSSRRENDSVEQNGQFIRNVLFSFSRD